MVLHNEAYASDLISKLIISLFNSWVWLIFRIIKIFKGLICSNPGGNKQEQARFYLKQFLSTLIRLIFS